MDNKLNKRSAAVVFSLSFLSAIAAIIQPIAAAVPTQERQLVAQTPKDLAGNNGIYKRDELVNIRYWRVVNPSGTQLIFDNNETTTICETPQWRGRRRDRGDSECRTIVRTYNQILPAGTIFESLTDSNGETIWKTQPLTRNKLITPIVYGIPPGARVKAHVYEIVPVEEPRYQPNPYRGYLPPAYAPYPRYPRSPYQPYPY
ncbi:hypothetical protein H6F77_10330 [Microcoleus sp. FACHB-831]|uniref:hypothetical protein n=1 Tax=Microcoleus sp. FACHB-831 TaxID=2692827 RepID=UPI00168594EC|nr:hypothetical protein [Microcoleus sp. FACHB-831]MBD1921487.1 hypothetical protein [Microcoleus sp. FACHB-831]